MTVGLGAGAYVWWFFPYRPVSSDFAQIWHSASGFLDGQNPYDIVGPGRAFQWDYPLLYPMTAVLTGVPFALVPLRLAETLFVGGGCGWLTWTLARRQPHAQWLFLSAAAIATVQTAQWGAVLTAAAMTPTLGFVLVAKPSIGLPLFLAYPSRRAALGCTALIVVSVAVWPGWVVQWFDIVRTNSAHVTAPIGDWRVGGPLLGLAVLRWRRPEARLLLGMSLIPHTPAIYDVVPLCLLIASLEEGLIFVMLTLLVRVAYLQVIRQVEDPFFVLQSHLITGVIYLPCLVMLLRRPNAWMVYRARGPVRGVFRPLGFTEAPSSVGPVTRQHLH